MISKNNNNKKKPGMALSKSSGTEVSEQLEKKKKN